MGGAAQRVKAELLRLGEHRLDEARLADPERARDEQRAAIAGRGTPKRAERRGELSLTPFDGSVKEPSRADRRAARELALERQRLLRGLRAEPRELVAQQAELPRGSWPVAARHAAAHERAVGLLVGGVLAQHLLPAALGAHHREAALAQPRARAESPLLVGVVGQQLAAIRGVVTALEALDVGAHLGGRGELHHSAAKHDRAAVAERAARVARGLVQVGRGSIGAELRPEQLEHLVARHAVAGSERQQLHEIRRAPLRPRVGRDRSRVHQHFEASEQPDLEAAAYEPTIPARPRPSLCPTKLALAQEDIASRWTSIAKDRAEEDPAPIEILDQRREPISGEVARHGPKPPTTSLVVKRIQLDVAELDQSKVTSIMQANHPTNSPSNGGTPHNREGVP